ncbi:hypothetical protein TMEN_5104 [Trichophyton mentagrophytes]|nr:hypothetical protein TMEN_5104 [Trichophyton mentagrophytes]
MAKILYFFLLSLLTALSLAIPGHDNSECAHWCKDNFAKCGYKNVGACVSEAAHNGASLQCSAKTTNASAHLTHAETIARSAKLLSNAFMANALVHLVLVEMTAKSAKHPSSARMANVFVLRTPVVMTVKNAKPLSNASMDSVLAQ